MQISAIRSAIADAAREVTVPGGTRALTCTGYLPDAITEPHFFIGDVSIEYDRAMNRALDALEVTARVLVGREDDISAQTILDGLLDGSGPGSLKAAIESARGAPGEYALDGLAHDLRVERVQGYRWFEHNGVTYIGAELIIRVIGAG
jgi:hypothetical protein